MMEAKKKANPVAFQSMIFIENGISPIVTTRERRGGVPHFVRSCINIGVAAIFLT